MNAVHPFWRTEPLSQLEIELLEAVSLAHYKSTFRQCPSTLAVQCAAQGSGDLFKAIAAALVTFGGRHGPIEATYDLLLNEYALESVTLSIIERGEKVPGWGSSFTEPGQADPFWKPVDEVLLKHFEPFRWRLTKVTQALLDQDIKVLPNPSAYTAITAIILGMPRHLAPYVLIMARLSAWAEIFLNELKGT